MMTSHANVPRVSSFTFPEAEADARFNEIGDEMSPEVRTMLNSALCSDEVDSSKYSAEFAKVSEAERVAIHRFLIVFDDYVSETLLRRVFVNSGPRDPEYLSVVRRIVLGLKLLKALAPYNILRVSGSVYDSFIKEYEDLLVDDKVVDTGRNATVDRVEAVVGDKKKDLVPKVPKIPERGESADFVYS